MLRFSVSALLLLSACASEQPPAAPIAAKPTAMTGSFCNGLIEGACTKMAGCQWIKRASAKDKQGQPFSDYCRPKIVAKAATKFPMTEVTIKGLFKPRGIAFLTLVEADHLEQELKNVHFPRLKKYITFSGVPSTGSDSYEL